MGKVVNTKKTEADVGVKTGQLYERSDGGFYVVVGVPDKATTYATLCNICTGSVRKEGPDSFSCFYERYIGNITIAY